jgi:DNA-binding MarR family transcriptional regulator
MNIHPDILDLAPVPPPSYAQQPLGRLVAFDDVVRAAGMRNVVTLSNPPDIRIHDGLEDLRVPRIGGPIYCISGLRLPFEERARAREILRRLAYGFFDYAAREIVARYHRDLKRASVVTNEDEEARVARRALSESSLRIKRALRETGSASIGELATMTGMAQPNVSRIVALMIESGVISAAKDGRRVVCRLAQRADETEFDPPRPLGR